jgi:hypothetical protein
LLGRGWGLSREYMLLAIVGDTFYYAGFEGLNMVEDAGDIVQ